MEIIMEDKRVEEREAEIIASEKDAVKTHDDIARTHRMKIIGLVFAVIGGLVIISMLWSMMFSGGTKERRRAQAQKGQAQVNEMVPDSVYEKNWQTNMEIEMEDLKKRFSH